MLYGTTIVFKEMFGTTQVSKLATRLLELQRMFDFENTASGEYNKKKYYKKNRLIIDNNLNS